MNLSLQRSLLQKHTGLLSSYHTTSSPKTTIATQRSSPTTHPSSSHPLPARQSSNCASASLSALLMSQLTTNMSPTKWWFVSRAFIAIVMRRLGLILRRSRRLARGTWSVCLLSSIFAILCVVPTGVNDKWLPVQQINATFATVTWEKTSHVCQSTFPCIYHARCSPRLHDYRSLAKRPRDFDITMSKANNAACRFHISRPRSQVCQTSRHV